jgi:hypothetical protein
MTPEQFNTSVVIPGSAFLATFAPEVPMSNAAKVLLVAISGQEAGWTARRQAGNGAAAGLFQFELGGIGGVMEHPASRNLARAACQAANVTFDRLAVWASFQTAAGDYLALAFARLLLWTDAAPLPAATDQEGGLIYYKRNWRPGDFRPDDWPDNHAAARRVILGAS